MYASVKGNESVGRMTKIFVIDFVWAFFNGLLLPTSHVAVAVSIIGWFIFAFIATAIFSQTLIDTEAKKRTPVTPITSFDQKSSITGSLILVGIIGVVPFFIGYAITPF